MVLLSYLREKQKILFKKGLSMKKALRRNRFIYQFYIILYRIFGRNKIKKGWKKDNNSVILGNAKLNRCVIRIRGKNNIVEIGSHNLLRDCMITLSGDGCKVTIGENGTFIRVEIVCEDNGSSVKTGDRCICAGAAHFAATEGKRIEIGDDFLCSNAVTIRTGDSHSIYDETGKRINGGKDVKISDHVWIGNQVIILKGVELGRDVVVGSGSVVRGHFSDNVIITGNPAEIIREKINWDFRR